MKECVYGGRRWVYPTVASVAKYISLMLFHTAEKRQLFSSHCRPPLLQ